VAGCTDDSADGSADAVTDGGVGGAGGAIDAGDEGGPDAALPDAAPPGSAGNSCPTDLASEPPCNPALADSSWAASHRTSYAQGSSPLEAPRAGDTLEKQHTYVTGVPVTMAFSAEYADGGRAIWSSPPSSVATIMKVDADTLEVIDEYFPREREADAPPPTLSVSGAYNLIDRDNRFIVARSGGLEVYADSVPGDRRSEIALVKRFTFPETAFCGRADAVVGVSMTYDGQIAFATERGVVGTVPREPERMIPENLNTLHLNDPAACDDDAAELEEVSNSIAVDEDGGIFVVTSGAMYRVDWDGSALSLGWRGLYELGDGESGIRLGEGSGSTPSLMGSGDEDRFVVLTDGQDIMHLVLMWRGEIPDDHEPVAPGRDRRIACEIPITFGLPDVTRSLSEQSVLVRGHSAIVVNDLLATPDAFLDQPGILRNVYAALEGGNPEEAPYGIERVDWDPEARGCRSVWANPEPSIPNAIPTMSERTGLIYAHGQQDGVWGLEAIDFETGQRAFFEPAPDQDCEALLERMAPLERAAARDVIARLPGSCENSVYAAAQVGPDGWLYQGTLYGISRYRAAR
jgi:hypothetical protein